jgi:hypothetical protein
LAVLIICPCSGLIVSFFTCLLTYWVQLRANLLFPEAKAGGLSTVPVSL